MPNDYTEKPDLSEYFAPQFYGIDNPPFDIDEFCIFKCVSGSRAYGTSTPTSDVDLRGVVLLPVHLLLGLNTVDQIENQSKDICYYGLKKAFTLLIKNNVHLMELLHMDKSDVIIERPEWAEVVNHKDIFTSKLIGYSFGGYAYGQLKILDTKKNNHTGRVLLIEQFGYDCKFAMHAVRLLRSGREFLETGVLKVKRPDAAELLEIRNGKYSYQEYIKWDDSKKQVVGGIIKDELDAFDKSWKNSTLPDKPNFNAINNLLINIQLNGLV